MGKLTKSTSDIQRILDESDGLKQHVESELATLKGSGEGSISAAVEAGVHRVLGGASEAYDTLKEIEDYIEKDEAGAVALAQSITRLETGKVSKADIDPALSTTSENPVMNKVVTAELNKKATKDEVTTLETGVNANKDLLETQGEKIQFLDQSKPNTTGYYPLLHVGTADTAIDLAGRGESVPASFGFRASGGKSIKDGRAYIKRIKGNSVVWNQKVNRLFASVNDESKPEYIGLTYTCDESTNILTINGTSTNTYQNILMANSVAGHTYYISARKVGGTYTSAGGRELQLYNGFAGAIAKPESSSETIGTLIGFTGVRTKLAVGCGVGDVFDNYQIKIQYIDLTQMFGAGNEPTTIEEFYARKPIVADEYAYNEGQVIHCNTESIKSVGDNAWDEEWEEGILVNGNNYFLEDKIRSKNYIKVIGGEEYCYNNSRGNINDYIVVFYYDENKNYLDKFNVIPSNKFTLPLSAHYIRFYSNLSYGGTYTNDIIISLVHSGWKQDTDAGYQPYWQDTLPLPIIRKYFPDGMKSAGSAHDEIRYNKASGKWEYSKGKIKSVDLGGFNWSMSSETYPRFFVKLNGAMNPSDYGLYANILCAKYINATAGETYNGVVGIALDNQGYLRVYDRTYTDAATFKAAMAGVILYYEAAEWEWVELDAEDQNFRDYYNVADFGTEQSQSSVPSAAFSADIIYQFNAVDMIREHELEIAELQKVIATMQAQMASLTNKE